jgi:hypothetical protein
VPGFVNYKKRCTRLAAASDQVYNGQWFSPGTPPSSTTKTDHHDIAEILLKVVLNTINQIKSNIILITNKTVMHILFSATQVFMYTYTKNSLDGQRYADEAL